MSQIRTNAQAEQGQPLIEKPARDEKENHDRADEKAAIDDERRSPCRRRSSRRAASFSNRDLTGQKRDRIDQRRQRRIVGVVPDFLGDVLAVPVATDRRRAAGSRWCASHGHSRCCAADLRLVHRLRSREAAEFVHEIKEREAGDHQRQRARV